MRLYVSTERRTLANATGQVTRGVKALATNVRRTVRQVATSTEKGYEKFKKFAIQRRAVGSRS